MKAIGYFRESAHGGESLALQHQGFLEYCKRHRLEVAATYAEESVSNGVAPAFRQLVAHVRVCPEADSNVLIASVDALGSDLRDAAVRLYQLESLGARVTPLSGGADAEAALLSLWKGDGANGRLSDKVRAAMRKKAVKGEVLGRPPYGYKVGSLRRLELVPEEAVVVRYIFRLYLHENLGIRLIARRLNEEELKTRRGGNWSMVSIRDILRNRAYLGTYSRFDVHVSGTHPALVSSDDFRKVQDRLNSRRTSGAPRTPSHFLLSGIAYCGYCGNKLIGVSRRQSWKRQDGERVSNSYRYYQCESRTNQSVCSYHTRRADDLEAAVFERLQDGPTTGLSMPTETPSESVRDERTGEPDRLRARIKSIDRKLESYIDAAVRGRITREKMHTLSVDAAKQRLVAEDALEVATTRAADRASEPHNASFRDERRLRLVATWGDPDFVARQSLLRDVLERITVRDDAVELQFRP